MRFLPLLPLALVLMVLTSVSPFAAAEDEVDPAKALLEQLTALRKAEDVGELAKAVDGVPDIYKASADKSLKGKICGELGKVVKDDDLGSARLAAVQALLGIDDPKAAWKELGKSMPGPKVEEASALQLAVVKAAGELAQSKAVKPLVELGFKAKDAKVAGAAAEALGGFKADTRGRTKIVEELITIGKRTRPGRSTDKATSPEASKRWEVVAPGVVNGLNRLTGRSVSSFEDWEALWDDYKKRPKELFVD